MTEAFTFLDMTSRKRGLSVNKHKKKNITDLARQAGTTIQIGEQSFEKSMLSNI